MQMEEHSDIVEPEPWSSPDPEYGLARLAASFVFGALGRLLRAGGQGMAWLRRRLGGS